MVSAVSASAEPDEGEATGGGIGWDAVVEANSEHIGADPEAIWVEAIGGDPGKKGRNGEWSVQCPNPFHNGDGDTKASLRWRVAPDGTVLIHCHGGCDYREILEAVGLIPVQLKVATTKYIYRARDRRVLGVKQRVEGVSGKTVFWHDRVDGIAPGLWLIPDLLEWARDREEAGAGPGVVWLTEGEKDATLVAGALGAGWVGETPGGPAVTREEVTTTTPDGAGSIGAEAADDIRALIEFGVTWRIAADPDPAGEARAETLRERLIAWGAESVEIWRWDGLDAGEAVSRYREAWLREAIVDTPIDPYRMPILATGMLYEGEFPDGSGYGLLVDQVGPRSTTTKPVMPVAPRVVGIETDAGRTIAWHLEWNDHQGVVHTERVLATEASSRRAYTERVVSRSGLSLQLGGGISIEQLAAWLEYHGRRAPEVRVTEVCGWLDGADRAGVGTGSEFATYEGPLVGHHAAVPGGGSEPVWHYGTEADDREAAELLIQILSLRPPSESVPVVAALAANAVRPWADEWSGAVRLMQIPALSGAGKTSFLRLAVRLFGSTGEGSGDESSASLGRTLAGGTGPVWIDDVRADQVAAITDQLRGAATGGARRRAVREGLTGVVGQKARAFIVYSAESELGHGDKAMTDRSLIVRFAAKVDGRVWSEGPWTGQAQFARMKELGAMSNDRHRTVTGAAGTLTRGLIAVAPKVGARLAEIEARSGDAAGGSGGGKRWERSGRWVRFGAESLAAWLRSVAAAEGGADGGWYWREMALEWAHVLVSEAGRWAANDSAVRGESAARGTDLYLVSELLPRAIRAEGERLGGWRELDERAVDPKVGIREATRVGGVGGAGGGRVMPSTGVVAWTYPVWETPEGEGEVGGVGEGGVEGKARKRTATGVAVNLDRLYLWATSDGGRRAGVGADATARHLTRPALQAQLEAVTTERLNRLRWAGEIDGEDTVAHLSWWVLTDVVEAR